MKLFTPLIFVAAVISVSVFAEDNETMTAEEKKQWDEAASKRAQGDCVAQTDVKRVGQANGSTDDVSCPKQPDTLDPFKPVGEQLEEEAKENVKPAEDVKPTEEEPADGEVDNSKT